jgi:hypothetical protein
MNDIDINEFVQFDMVEYRARKFAIDRLSIDPYYEVEKKDIYHYGIWRGGSLVFFDKYMDYINMRPHYSYGFDSFTGFPAETDGVAIHKAWTVGKFSTHQYYEEQDVNVIMEYLYSQVSDNVKIFPGYFKDVFNHLQIAPFRPACLVDIDCDLHSSTTDVLEFMTKNNLLVKGTLLVYDDWGGVKEYAGGESLAHKEWTEKYKIQCDEIFTIGKKPNIQKVFEIRSI